MIATRGTSFGYSVAVNQMMQEIINGIISWMIQTYMTLHLSCFLAVEKYHEIGHSKEFLKLNFEC